MALLDILAAGSGLLGAGAALYGSKKQADAIEDSTAASVGLQREIFNQNREDLTPWREAGKVGLSRLLDPATNFTTSPGYDFRLREGMRLIDNNASARGMVGSGSRLRALMDYGQGKASEEYGNWWNQNSGLAGIGQTATNAGVTSGNQFGATAGSAIQQGGSAAGTATGGGVVGAANALGGAVNNYLLYDYLRR